MSLFINKKIIVLLIPAFITKNLSLNASQNVDEIKSEPPLKKSLVLESLFDELNLIANHNKKTLPTDDYNLESLCPTPLHSTSGELSRSQSIISDSEHAPNQFSEHSRSQSSLSHQMQSPVSNNSVSHSKSLNPEDLSRRLNNISKESLPE